MKKLNIKSIFNSLPLLGGSWRGALLACVLVLASCSDEKIDYTPAEPVDANNWGVYFDSSNKNEFPRTPQESNSLEFTLKRTNTNGELTVPLELNTTSGTFQAPQSATFANGEDETTVSITYDANGLKDGRLIASISIPELYINPYVEKPGFYKQSILVYQPNIIGRVVLRQVSGSIGQTDKLFENIESLITQVPGENRFFWTNFLGSGATFSFKLDKDDSKAAFNASDITKCKGPIIPLNHYVMYEDSGLSYWYYCEEEDAANMDDEEVSLFTWNFTDTKGVEKAVNDYILFYTGYDYMRIDFSKLYETYGSGRLYGLTVDDLYDDYWIYVYPVTEE